MVFFSILIAFTFRPVVLDFLVHRVFLAFVAAHLVVDFLHTPLLLSISLHTSHSILSFILLGHSSPY